MPHASVTVRPPHATEFDAWLPLWNGYNAFYGREGPTALDPMVTDTTRIELTTYLQDLFTAPEVRGQGIGRALIEAVCAAAANVGVKRVYWQTHQTNAAGRLLYDKLAKHHGFIIYARDLS